jgi:hypothetical protein
VSSVADLDVHIPATVRKQIGLAVDISHISGMSTGNVVYPIQCAENVDYRTFPLLVNSYLQLLLNKLKYISNQYKYCIMNIYLHLSYT